jgi:two-component system LytT family response regulator
MASVEEKLDPRLFMRVHRSAIVRLDRVRSVSRGVYGTIDLHLGCGQAVRVGRKYGADVRARLG